MNPLLIPFSTIYGWIMNLRNAAYDRGILMAHDLGAAAISVGNLTTGGTGKTPLVASIAEILADHGEKVCILTRGYGRKKAGERVVVSDGESILADAETGGDEPAELARRLAGKAVIVADRDRVSAAKWARERFGITAFILDDGFQHRRAKRDLDILCVDATDLLSDARMLPAGKLREPLSNAERADAFVLTRSDLVSENEANNKEDVLRSLNPAAQIFRSANSISAITKLEDLLQGRETAAGDDEVQAIGSPFAFCGLGNPDNFLNMLVRQNFRICGTHLFADHRHYVQDDIDMVERSAKYAAAGCLLTTVKDAVKLEGLTFTMPVFVVEVDPLISDHEAFTALVTSFCRQPDPKNDLPVSGEFRDSPLSPKVR